MEQLSFWEKWKVFIFGLLGSIALAVQAALTESGPGQDTKVYLYAALMAAISYISTAWRGQGITLTGILGTLAGVFVSLETTGSFSWFQFFVSGLLAVLSATASPPKALTYEKNINIVNAKDSNPEEIVEDKSHLPVGNFKV